MGGRLTLAAGGLRLELAPELGGAIASFSHDGVDLLRPTPVGTSEVLETASFPLTPYANRIADGRIAFGGRTARLRRNAPGQPHPLHGDGWRGPWAVETSATTSATLAFTPAASDWPWPYVARQTFRLGDDGLTVELSMTNAGADPAPAGLGFHPYFPNAGRARLTARTDGVWLIDDDFLPVRHVEGSPFAAWASGAEVATGDLVDHCHTGWDGEARIELGPDRPALKLTASPELGFLHIYAPPGQDFFCVEPVSHRPDAINADDPKGEGVRLLAAGETFAVWMRLQPLV
jgi:aldose 1-epimerase